MKTRLPEPERWSARPASGDSAEDLLGASMRSVRGATEPTEFGVARLGRWRQALWASRQDRRSRPVGRTALFLIFFLTGSAIAGAGGRLVQRHWSTETADLVLTQPPVSVRNDVHRPERAWARPVVANVASPPGDSESPLALKVTTAAEQPDAEPAKQGGIAEQGAAWNKTLGPPAHATRRLPSVGMHIGNEPSSASGEEARLLSAAFRALRSGGDPRAGLRILDRHQRRFPAGALREEARVARVEALLALGREADAAATMSEAGAVDGSGGALPRSLQLARGELHAMRGHCAEALRDFNALVAGGMADAATARALYGRASCFLRAGEAAAARPDLNAYLRLAPEGPLAAAVRSALAELP